MAYDEGLAERVREMVSDRPGVTERKMFGGLSWMVGGNMACGVLDEDLLVRLSPEEAEAAWEEPGTRPLQMPGRAPMKGFVLVEPSLVAEDAELASWVDSGLSFASTLPAK